MSILDDVLNHEKRLRVLENQEIGLASATAFVKLAEKSGSSAGYSFTGISGDYNNLLIIAYLRSDRPTVPNDNLAMTFNGDTGNNYEWLHMRWTHDTGAVGGNEFSQGASLDAHIEVSFVEASGQAPADVFSPTWILIPDYSNATDHKGCLSQTGFQQASYINEQLGVDIGHGLWHTTAAAITQIDLDPEIGTNWEAGSRATLYGIG